MFETTIRYLGGLLSAYALSGESILLEKAVELGDALLPAFSTPSGLPYHQVHLVKYALGRCAGATEIVALTRVALCPYSARARCSGDGGNPSWTGGAFILAEVGSVQLEFVYLSQVSGNPAYANAALKAMDYLDKLEKPIPGLYPIFIHNNKPEFTIGERSVARQNVLLPPFSRLCIVLPWCSRLGNRHHHAGCTGRQLLRVRTQAIPAHRQDARSVPAHVYVAHPCAFASRTLVANLARRATELLEWHAHR